MTATEWIALATFVLTVVASIIGLTWGVSRVADKIKDQLHKDLEKYKSALSAKVDELEELIAVKELSMERKLGETGNAFRTKITEVELYMRDNYVRNKELESLSKLFGERLDRLQLGVDKIMDKMFKHGAGDR